jgi:hypothetical protein
MINSFQSSATQVSLVPFWPGSETTHASLTCSCTMSANLASRLPAVYLDKQEQHEHGRSGLPQS